MLGINDIDGIMSSPTGLDPDLLRTFAAIADEGSFTRAAERVGRTQSAVSMQVQRLEGVLGHRLITRGKGGHVTLTAHGNILLRRARELLALNDDIWNSFRTPAVHGAVRLGTPDDYALRYLPQILMRFAEKYPAVEVDVLCLPSVDLIERLRAEELDLTLVSDGPDTAEFQPLPLWSGPLVWVTTDRGAPHKKDPLPLALARDHCSWRQAALASLEAAHRRYRIVYRSSTHVGTHAPALAGLAVTVSTSSWLPEGLRPVLPEEGLPPLPDFGISLLTAARPRQPVTDALARYIADTFRQETARAPKLPATRAA